MSERLLTARELAEYLGISAATVLDRFERGDLGGFRLFGRKGGPVRFRLSEVEVALESWHVNETERRDLMKLSKKRVEVDVIAETDTEKRLDLDRWIMP